MENSCNSSNLFQITLYSLALIKVGKKINIRIDLVHLTIIKHRFLESILACVCIEESRVGIGVGACGGQERSW